MKTATSFEQPTQEELAEWLLDRNLPEANAGYGRKTALSLSEELLDDYDVRRKTYARPTVDEYYLGIAAAVSARGECSRRRVGAVIVRDGSIMGTGFNGAPPGERSCLDGACPRAYKDVVGGIGYADSGCVVIHAEMNAIIRAGRERCLGATLYVTHECCELCAPLVRAAGITRVVTPSSLG